MGTEKRSQNNEAADLKNRPGPGTYVAKSFVGEGPKIQIKSRPKAEKLNASMGPGPGAYKPNILSVLEKPPAIGLGHGVRGGLQNKATLQVPGPGAYTSVSAHKDGPKFGFGSGKRGEQKANQYPGPGNYSIPTAIGELPPHEKSKHL